MTEVTKSAVCDEIRFCRRKDDVVKNPVNLDKQDNSNSYPNQSSTNDMPTQCFQMFNKAHVSFIAIAVSFKKQSSIAVGCQ